MTNISITSRMRSILLPGLLTGAALAGFAAATPAMAAEADDVETAADEIVVTARKRAEDIQSVPITISAYTAQDLADRNINSLGDLGASTPGLAINSIAGGNTQTIYIRGLAPANTASDLNVEANVGVFIDGIYQTSRNTLDILSVLDVGQIEIAKGPQSALFGRSTFAGAMSISTGKPTDELGGAVTATAGVDQDIRLRGHVNLPVSETLKVRLAGGYSSYDGWGKNSAAPDDNLGGYAKYAASGAIELTPSENFRAVLSGFVTHSKAELTPAYMIQPGQLNCGNVNAATALPLLFCGTLTPRDTVDLSPNLKPTLNKNRQGSLLLEAKFGGVKATSVTGVTGSDNRGFSDYDLTSGGVQFGVCQIGNATNAGCGANFLPAPYTRLVRSNLTVATVERVRTFSQELRFQSDNDSKFNWILGGYYFNSRIPLAAAGIGAGNGGIANTERFIQVNQLATPAAAGVGAYDATANIFTVTDASQTQLFGSYTAASTKTSSLFAAIGYDFGSVRVNAEGRYNSDKKQAQVFSIANPTLAPFVNQPITGTAIPTSGTFPIAGTVFKRKFNSFAPRFTVDYKPTEEILLYASAAKGVRSGGFNTANPVSATGILASEVPYEEETNWTYEGGVKSRLFDRALLLNLAVFHTDWQDAQVSAFTQNPTAVNPVRIVQNAGAIKATGIEAQAEVTINIFSVGGSFIYSDPKFQAGSYDGSQITQCRVGTAAPFSSANGCPAIIPVPTANGGTQFVPSLEGLRPQRSVKTQWNLHATVEVPVSGDWNLSGRVDVNHTGSAFNNLLNTVAFGDRTVTNLRIAVDNGRYSAALWATNLFDSSYVQNSINQPRAGYPAAFSLPEVYMGEGRRMGLTLGAKF
ncbi:MAG: TonB-dependent receptor [Alphaproteobacteria bacterium]|nr:TonB-dependent receptor [Alphaproteobacteria bacterium]